MAKFHIGKSGKPAQCRAKNGNCPFGSEKEHYKTRDEANKAVEGKLSNETNHLSSNQKKDDTITPENFVYYNDQFSEEERKQQQQEFAQIVSNTIILSKNATEDMLKEREEKMLDMLNKGGSNEEWNETELQIEINLLSYEYGEKYGEAVKKVIHNLERENKQNLWQRLDELENLENMEGIEKQILQASKDEGKGNILSEHIEPKSFNQKRIFKAKDLNKGFYYIESGNRLEEESEYGGKTFIVYAPDGFDKVKEKDIYNVYDFRGFDGDIGLSGIEDREIIEKLLENGLYEAIRYSNISNRGRDMILMPLQKKSTIRMNEKSMKEKAIARNFDVGDTYIQQARPDIKFKDFGDKLTNAAYHKVGMSITSETQKSYAQKASQSSVISKKVTDMKEGRYGKMTGTKSEIEELSKVLSSLPEKDVKLLTDYSTNKYGEYSAKSYGYIKDSSKVSNENIKRINDTIKEIENKSNGRKRFVYRGAKTPNGMSREQYLDSLNIGDVTVTNRITSASRKADVMNSFNKDNRFHKHVNFIYHTKKGAYVSPISEYESEEEVLLGIGEKMVVADKGIDKDGNAFVIFVDAKE